MKFQVGDEVDRALAKAMLHEFMRCHDAFEDFFQQAGYLIMLGDSKSRSYAAYNAYARFIHHLYEFLLAAMCRERRSTASIPAEDAEARIMQEAQRALRQRRTAIEQGYAPPWGNALSAYENDAPQDLAREFRRHRNLCNAHVDHHRADLSLSLFYQRFHRYLYMIYSDSRWLWEPKEGQFPDLGEVTSFSVAVIRSAASPGT